MGREHREMEQRPATSGAYSTSQSAENRQQKTCEVPSGLMAIFNLDVNSNQSGAVELIGTAVGGMLNSVALAMAPTIT